MELLFSLFKHYEWEQFWDKTYWPFWVLTWALILGIHKTSIKILFLTVLTLSFPTSTSTISPPSLPKTFKTISLTFSGFKFNLLVTLWLCKTFVHQHQKVYVLFYYNHFQSKLYQLRLFATKQNTWILILTGLTILTCDDLRIFNSCNLMYILKQYSSYQGIWNITYCWISDSSEFLDQ